MAKTVVGLFDTFAEARNAVQDLVDMGIARDRISLVANDARGEFGSTREVGEPSAAAEGAGAGAVGGTLAGGALGLLIGTGLLVIPGIGPVLAAGPLAAAIGSTAAAVGATALGAGIGAATGGLLGGLIGAGVPESEAHTYTEGVRRGGTLVSVHTEDTQAEAVRDLLLRNGAVDIDRRSAEWREDGWTGGAMRDVDATDDTAGEEWRESSKLGTAGGTAAGAATGAAIGAAGGPAGALIGGIAGAATGAAAGAAGDVAGERADDNTREMISHGRDKDPYRTPTAGTVGMAGAADPAFDRGTRHDDVASDSAADPDYARGLRHGEPLGDDDFARGQHEGPLTGSPDFARGQHEGPLTGSPDFARGQRTYDQYDSDFRSHYGRAFATGGRAYEQYEPAYRFGHDAAASSSASTSSWDEAELRMRQDWERDHPNTWEQMKDSIRYAWEKARGLR